MKKILDLTAVVMLVVSIGLFMTACGKDANKNGVADKLEPSGLYVASPAENRSYLLYFEKGDTCHGAAVSLSINDGQKKVEIRENNWRKYTVSKSGKILELEVKNNSGAEEKTFNPVDKSFAQSFSGVIEGKEQAFVKIDDIKQFCKDKYSLSDIELDNVIADWGFWHDYWVK
jgi:hypothetical protein